MENQEQNEQSNDLEQNEQGQGSSALEQQGYPNQSRNRDNNQNDIAGNANDNEQEGQGAGGNSSDTGQPNTDSEDAQELDESYASDCATNNDGADRNEDFNDIDTDEDDEFSRTD